MVEKYVLLDVIAVTSIRGVVIEWPMKRREIWNRDEKSRNLADELAADDCLREERGILSGETHLFVYEEDRIEMNRSDGSRQGSRRGRTRVDGGTGAVAMMAGCNMCASIENTK